MSGQPIKDFQPDLGTPYLLENETPTDEKDVVLQPGQQVWILTHYSIDRTTMVEVDGKIGVYWIDGDTLVAPVTLE